LLSCGSWPLVPCKIRSCSVAQSGLALNFGYFIIGGYFLILIYRESWERAINLPPFRRPMVFNLPCWQFLVKVRIFCGGKDAGINLYLALLPSLVYLFESDINEKWGRNDEK